MTTDAFADETADETAAPESSAVAPAPLTFEQAVVAAFKAIIEDGARSQGAQDAVSALEKFSAQ